MRSFFLILFTALFTTPAFAFPWGGVQIEWDTNLQRAQNASRQTGKPVLLHFYSDTCPPCRMMESNTFPDKNVVELVNASFIPVKLNTREHPQEANSFNVQAVPMDFVISPDGNIIKASKGGQGAGQYCQFLASARPAPIQQPPVANPAVSPVNPYPPNPQGGVNPPPALPDFPGLPPEKQGTQTPPITQIGSAGACPIDETPSFDYSKIPDEEKAIIEYEGYCPVELGKKQLWTRGDYRIKELFEGRLYLFAGEAQRAEFKRNPFLYAPAYQGIDIVAWKETGKKVQGTRYFGAWAAGRVFLFASEANLIKFEKNARFYLTP